MADDDIPDMPADGAARYRVLVAEAQRQRRALSAADAWASAAGAELRRLRVALGLAEGAPVPGAPTKEGADV